MTHRLHVLDHGTISLDKSLLLAGVGLATANDKAAPAHWTSVPTYSVLLEHPEGRVLFDTGCHPDARNRWPEGLQALEVWEATEECYLLNRLERLGLGPEDIDIVVASHLHMDHCGCLEYFRDATAIVHRDELRGALEHYATPGYVGGYVKQDIAAWIEAGIRWHIVDRDMGDQSLFDGVTILNLGSGHVEGLLGLSIAMPESGVIILASDACYSQANFGPPPVLPGVGSIYDSLGMLRTAERLRAYARETRGTIWFGHDPDQFATLRKSPDGYYE